MMTGHDPAIIVFACSFGWGYQGDRERLASTIPNWLPMTCCGRLEAEQLLEPFGKGADGVLVLACPVGECHFQQGENQLHKRVRLLKELLAAHRIDPERLSVHFGSDPSGETIGPLVAAFAQRLVRLGPTAAESSPT